MSHLVGWRFQFGAMRRLLESDKASDVRQESDCQICCANIQNCSLSPTTVVPDDHFTVVELDGIDEEYSAQLNRRRRSKRLSAAYDTCCLWTRRLW